MLPLILQVLTDYGWMALAGLVFLFVAIKLGLMFAEGKIKALFTSTPEPELQYHQFFANIQYKLVSEIPALYLFKNKPVRQQVFRDLLLIYFKILFEKAQYITAMDSAKWSAARWTQEVLVQVRQMTTEFNSRCVEEGIPAQLVHKFAKWHSTSAELLYEYITTLGTSAMYPNNKSRTTTLLLVLDLLTVITIADAERSMHELNGEISGHLYRGKEIES